MRHKLEARTVSSTAGSKKRWETSAAQALRRVLEGLRRLREVPCSSEGVLLGGSLMGRMALEGAASAVAGCAVAAVTPGAICVVVRGGTGLVASRQAWSGKLR